MEKPDEFAQEVVDWLNDETGIVSVDGACPQCKKDGDLVRTKCIGCGLKGHIRCTECGYVDFMHEIGGLSAEARYAAEMLAGPGYCIRHEFLYGQRVAGEDSTISVSYTGFTLIELAKGITELSDRLHQKRLERIDRGKRAD